MNETVKAALLNERMLTKHSVQQDESDLRSAQGRVASLTVTLNRHRGRLADIELHLKDNGVDLAAVDAEAEKARPKPSGLSTGLMQGYGQPLVDQSNLGQGYVDLGALSGVNKNRQQ